MKRALAILALAFGLGLTAQPTQHFRWDWRNAQELDYGKTVGKSVELSTAERRQLVHAIAERLKTSMDAGANASAIALKARVKFIDLNGDGRPEVIAQPVGLESGCGATGNCPFWVFEKTPAGYQLILRSEGGFQVFTIEPATTNGFSDMVLGTHDSAGERTLYLFRYSEGRYRRRACYNANWWTYEGGFHKLKQPQITPCAK